MFGPFATLVPTKPPWGTIVSTVEAQMITVVPLDTAGLGDRICILRQGHPVENPPVEIEACEAGHAVFDAPIGVIGNAVSRSYL